MHHVKEDAKEMGQDAGAKNNTAEHGDLNVADLHRVSESQEHGSWCRREKNKRRNLKFRLSSISFRERSILYCLYPRTLILENDSTARLGVGRPIDSAGRNVVKISIRFTCGSTSWESEESDRMR